MKRIWSFLILIPLWLAPGISQAGVVRCHELHSGPQATGIFSELSALYARDPKTLALQSDFDRFIKPSGGGACASATAFNLLQGLRQMMGLPLLNSHEVLKNAYADQPVLLDGRVTNLQLENLLNYFAQYIPGRNLHLQIDQSSARQKLESSDHWTTWENIGPDLLKARSREIKILIYKVATPEGRVLGRHFVILKEFQEPMSVVVLDPNYPTKQFAYSLKSVPLNSSFATTLQLINPKVLNTFTVDSIFTVRLE